MSLDPLATIDDLQTRLGRTLADTDEDRAGALLRGASATVRNWTGQLFTADTGTIRVRSRGATVRLPQRPVTAINDVADTDGNSIGFTWYGGDTLVLDTPVDIGWVDVDYDHGYEEIPDDIVTVVCQIAGRALGTPADEGGYSAETIGTYSYTVGVTAAAGSTGMLNDERAILASYRGVGGTAWLAS